MWRVLTKGFADGVTSLSCHNILQCVLSAYIDGKSRLRDFTTGRVVSKFKEHRDAVTSISIDPVRGFCVATGCHDGFVRRFNLRTGPSGAHALLTQKTCPVKPRSARSMQTEVQGRFTCGPLHSNREVQGRFTCGYIMSDRSCRVRSFGRRHDCSA